MEFWIEEVLFFLIICLCKIGQNSTAVYPSWDGDEDLCAAAATVFLEKGFVYRCDHVSVFGAKKHAIIAAIWRLIYPYISGKLCIKHLLWELTFLQQFSYKQVLSQAAEWTPKTFCKRVLEVLTTLNKQYNDVVSTNFTNLNLPFWCNKPNLFLFKRST